jgi:very-short-patch-repair endonuclease
MEGTKKCSREQARADDVYRALQSAVSAICSNDLTDCRLQVETLDCESPIEDMLCLAIMVHLKLSPYGSYGPAGMSLIDFVDWVRDQYEARGSVYFAAPQVNVDRFRMDFLVAYIDSGAARFGIVGVECDGHSFHERTPEQALRDKSKDRDLLSAGIPIIRFTGREIYSDPGACANEALSMAARVAIPLSEAPRRFRPSVAERIGT